MSHQFLRKSRGSDDHCTEFCVVTCWKCMKKTIRNNKTDIKKRKRNEKKWNEKKRRKMIFFLKKYGKKYGKHYGKKVRGKDSLIGRNSHQLRLRIGRTYFRTWPLPGTSLPVTWLPVMRNGPTPFDPSQTRLELYPYNILVSSAVDREFKRGSGQTKYYKIDMCCFSAKYAALRSKSNDWLDRNHNNVSEWKRHVYPRTVASVR
jgi:hypothetical protein